MDEKFREEFYAAFWEAFNNQDENYKPNSKLAAAFWEGFNSSDPIEDVKEAIELLERKLGRNSSHLKQKVVL